MICCVSLSTFSILFICGRSLLILLRMFVKFVQLILVRLVVMVCCQLSNFKTMGLQVGVQSLFGGCCAIFRRYLIRRVGFGIWLVLMVRLDYYVITMVKIMFQLGCLALRWPPIMSRFLVNVGLLMSYMVLTFQDAGSQRILLGFCFLSCLLLLMCFLYVRFQYSLDLGIECLFYEFGRVAICCIKSVSSVCPVMVCVEFEMGSQVRFLK